MKKKINFVLKVLLSFTTLIGCVGLVACKDEPEQEGPSVGGQESEAFYFLDEPNLLTVGETKLVSYYVGERLEEQAVMLTSSNPSVLTVTAEGELEAINVGTAKITGTVGTYTDNFEVSVVLDGSYPQLFFKNAVNEEKESLTVNKKLNLGCEVFYNDRYFDDVEVDYTVSDPTVGTVDMDGVFTALKKGSVSVTATATWRGIESPLMTKSVNVDIVNDISVLIADGALTDITLYSKANFMNNTYMTSVSLNDILTVSVDGVDKTNESTYEVIDNRSAADSSIEAIAWDSVSKTLTASKVGTAKLEISIPHEGETLMQTINLACEKPFGIYETPITFSQMDGVIEGLDGIFGESVTLTAAYQDGDETTGTARKVEDNKIVGLILSTDKSFSTETVTVYTEDCGVQLTLNACKKIIKTHEDMASVYGTATAAVSGYFFLANDILWGETEAEQFTAKPGVASWHWNSQSTFSGVFDGNGHTVEFATTRAGLFGTLSGTVKNATFIVKKVNTYASGDSSHRAQAQGAILANYFIGTISNVYARYDVAYTPDFTAKENDGGQNRCTQKPGLVAFNHYGKIENTILDMRNVTLQGVSDLATLSGANIGFGVFGWTGSSTYVVEPSYIKNSYVIWENEELAVKKSGTDLYVSLAKNDGNTLTGYIFDKEFKNVTRYATLADMAAAVETVGNFSVTADGIRWAN